MEPFESFLLFCDIFNKPVDNNKQSANKRQVHCNSLLTSTNLGAPLSFCRNAEVIIVSRWPYPLASGMIVPSSCYFYRQLGRSQLYHLSYYVLFWGCNKFLFCVYFVNPNRCMCTIYTQGPEEAKGGRWTPWNYSCR